MVEVCDDAASMLRTIRDAGVKVGISLNPETDVSVLEGLLGLVDLVLVMSVHPGFGGQSFIESSPAKIAAIVEMCKAEGAAPLIEVDGGIGVATAAAPYVPPALTCSWREAPSSARMTRQRH